MDYMLLIYDVERGGPPEGEVMELCGGLVERLAEKGQYRSAGVLQPTATATTLRMREGQRLVTDGPFAETREQLAGYLVVQAESLDAALAIAAEHPVARTGSVEVRPLYGIPNVHSLKSS